MRRQPWAVIAFVALFSAFSLGMVITLTPDMASGDEGHAHSGVPAHNEASSADHKPIELTLRMPKMDSERGMVLFIEKGCVACHAVNGVGGHDAAPLDAHGMEKVMNPFEFAAKMWRMAPYMIAAQEEALGGQILFTGDELADIIAFVHDDAQQHRFSEAMLTPEVRRMMHHEHGGMSGAEGHAGELGHTH